VELCCRNCREMRAVKLNSSPRTQCQVAVSSSHEEWFLRNASPALRIQIVGAAELDSRGHLRDLKAVSERGVRHSPIVGVRRLPSDGCLGSKTYSSTCSPSSLGKASGRIVCRKKVRARSFGGVYP